MHAASPRTPFSPSTRHHIISLVANNASSLSVLVGFCIVSSALVIHNKILLDRHTGYFPHSMLLMWFQTITSLVILGAAKFAGILRFKVEWNAPADWVTGLVYVMSVFTGLLSLSYVSIPIFSTLKRLGLVVSWAIEYFFSRRPETTKTLAPLITMLVGITVAGSADLEFNFMGYFLGITSCVTAASSFELSRRVAQSKNKGVWAVLMMNSVVTAILLTPYLLWSGEIQKYANPFKWESADTKIHLPLNCALCLLLNFLIFKNVSVNTALTHMVSGNVKTILTTVVGAFVVKSSGINTVFGWLGITASCAGAVWFSVLKSKAAIQKEWKSSVIAFEKLEQESSSSPTTNNDKEEVEVEDEEGDDDYKRFASEITTSKNHTKNV